ncbi:hypothetical protein MMPV_000147 [Pyropia vietnamensis]
MVVALAVAVVVLTLLLGLQTVRLAAAGVAPDGAVAVAAVTADAADARIQAALAAASAATAAGQTAAESAGKSLAVRAAAPSAVDGGHTEDELRGMPECAAGSGRASNFLMVFMGHSGSTAMMTALQPHSQVHITGLEPVDHYERATNTASALAYAHAFFSAATARNQTGGFKIRPRHIRRAPTAWRALVRRHGVRIIWQYRQNMLKQAVGTYTIDVLGDRTAYEGVVVSPQTSPSPPSVSSHSAGGSNTTSAAAAMGGRSEPSATPRVTRFRADPHTLYDIMRNRVLGDQEVTDAIRLLGADGCVLPVSYEEFHADPAATMRRVSGFLGIDPAEAHPPMRAKATSDALCEVLTNWAEVCAAFYPCPELRPLLDDAVCRCSSALAASTFVPTGSSPYCLVKRPRLLGERARDPLSRYRRPKPS